MIDETNDPGLRSWVETAQGSDFPIQNLPLGIFSVGQRRRRACVAIGDYVLDLAGIAELLDEEWLKDLTQPVLNAWLGTRSAGTVGPARAADRDSLGRALPRRRGTGAGRPDRGPNALALRRWRLH